MLHQAVLLIENALAAQVTEDSLRVLSSSRPIQAAASGSPNFMLATLQMVAALAFVLALILGVAWLAKKYLPAGAVKARAGDRIDLLAARPLGLRRSLMLVRAHGRVFLVGATPQQISCLSEWDEDESTAGNLESPDEEEQGRASAIESFQQLLAKRQQSQREKP